MRLESNQSMGEVVNLRTQRKRRARAEKEAQAARNRVRHGLPKAARNEADREAESIRREHDGKRLDEED